MLTVSQDFNTNSETTVFQMSSTRICSCLHTAARADRAFFKYCFMNVYIDELPEVGSMFAAEK